MFRLNQDNQLITKQLTMIIGGLQKFSLLDFPGRVAAIIFTGGCNFRCPFCYNPMLVWPKGARKLNKKNLIKAKTKEKDHFALKQDDLFRFLEKRINKLEAVVITGGEPTLHPDLINFIKKIKRMGYLVKLDTNGTNPEMLIKLLEKKLIDYIAMDIKAPADKHEKVTGINKIRGSEALSFKIIEKSVRIIKASGLPHEFRTTVVPSLIDKSDIIKIGKVISGAETWYLQKFRSEADLVDDKYKNLRAYTHKEIEEMRAIGNKYVKKCKIR